MRCSDCARYPFCSHIHKPSDEACDYVIKRNIEDYIQMEED